MKQTMKPPNNTPGNASGGSKPKMIDVTKPGESVPNPTTRPLIVTHRPMVQDPMMKSPVKEPEPETAQPAEPVQAAPVTPAQKIKLEPSQVAVDEVAASPPETLATTEVNADKEQDEQTADNEMNASQAALAKKEAETQAALNAEHEKIIDSRKYFVAIHASSGQHAFRYAVIGAVVVILVGLACIDILLDAGLLDLSGLPHTNFIHQ